jgi:hypothetical protein
VQHCRSEQEWRLTGSFVVVPQHGTWQVFRGDSTSSSALVAEIKPSLMSIGGKKIKVCLAGRDEPEFVIQVRAVWSAAAPNRASEPL